MLTVEPFFALNPLRIFIVGALNVMLAPVSTVTPGPMLRIVSFFSLAKTFFQSLHRTPSFRHIQKDINFKILHIINPGRLRNPLMLPPKLIARVFFDFFHISKRIAPIEKLTYALLLWKEYRLEFEKIPTAP